MSSCSKIQVTYSARGIPRYHIVVSHKGLSKNQVVRGDDTHIVKLKANFLMDQWDAMWEKRVAIENKSTERKKRKESIEENKSLAMERTAEAIQHIESLKNTLLFTLTIDDSIDWDSLKNHSDYSEEKPQKPSTPNRPLYPEIPREPQKSDSNFVIKLNLLDKLFSKRKEKKEMESSEKYYEAHHAWKVKKNEIIQGYNILIKKHEEQIKIQEDLYQTHIKEWDQKRTEYLQERTKGNEIIDKKKELYLTKDPDAILDYCGMVLDNSIYPDYFPQSYELDFNIENGILVVDYNLPAIETIPKVIEIKYVQSKDEFVEKEMSSSEFNKLYDDLLYQISLRTIHELFEADKANALTVIVFNGYVHSTDPSTGKEIDACILSIQAQREEFMEINLSKVDPKACFKKLKGVGSSKLHSLTPIPPLLKINREDSRFVDSYAMTQDLDEGFNLATMDWEDFEHLIRELFEKEFSSAGGEVKVTRASRDGGVDAVIFDPDPIRGGKIVVQAKRYANTVGVSAVRDLYGTLLNEGANKGILVTTSDYGPDAYEFARGKPLTLLSGGNLLHLLQKHGHRAKIDLKEAKDLLSKKMDSK